MTFSEFIKKFRFYWPDHFFVRSYSQFGEDLLVKAFLGDKWSWNYRGFYVDIGAHDPKSLSNTKKFYDVGWRGINVDASTTAISKFNRYRKRDINVNVGIGLQPGMLEYYRMSASPMNTFSKAFADKAIKQDGVKLIGVEKIPVITMKELLDKHLPNGQIIDFANIDCEGLDLDILKSNDWVRYRPELILIEIHTNGETWEIPQTPAAQFLDSVGYKLIGQSLLTSLFKRTV